MLQKEKKEACFVHYCWPHPLLTQQMLHTEPHKAVWKLADEKNNTIDNVWNPFHNKHWPINTATELEMQHYAFTKCGDKNLNTDVNESSLESVLKDIANQNLGRIYEQWHHVLSCNRLKRMLTSSISIQSMPELLEMFHGRRGVKSSIW